MKKIFFSLLLLFTVTASVNAQVTNDPNPMANTPANQLENNALIYNSPVNPYCTEMYKSYWIWDKTSVAWVQRVELVAPCPAVPNAIPPKKVNPESNNPINSNPGMVIIKPKPGGQ